MSDHREPRVEPRWALMRRSVIPDFDRPERTYLARLRVAETPWIGLFVHIIRLPDSDRALHDHPWGFWSLIVSGGYRETFAPDLDVAAAYAADRTAGRHSRRTVQRTWRRRSVHGIRRGQLHAITELSSEPTWTLLLVGRRRADWGFATAERFLDHQIRPTSPAPGRERRQLPGAGEGASLPRLRLLGARTSSDGHVPPAVDGAVMTPPMKNPHDCTERDCFVMVQMCRGCNQGKPLTDFHKASRFSSGHQRQCKQCASQSQRLWSAAHKGESYRRKIAQNPDYYADRKLINVYGITRHEYDALLKAQGGLCAICGQPNNRRGRMTRPLVVDHSHMSGKVRGLLCNRCNTALGFLETQDLLARMLAYLERSS